MPRSCVAVNCTEMYKKSSGVSFHKFPADSERHKSWIISVDQKESSPRANDRLCGKHFLEGKRGFHFNLRPEACLCAGKALPDRDHRDFVPMAVRAQSICQALVGGSLRPCYPAEEDRRQNGSVVGVTGEK
uniref:THAP-type domain-containing protein n=1 Tax=Ixodes ricinus TaxID=34613 RepID=A0A6B0UQU7_IXORI